MLPVRPATFSLNTDNAETARDILTFSFANKLSHIGSCLTAAPIINEIFDQKAAGEKFILSCGHAGVALYIILQRRFGINAQELFDTHGVHPSKDLEHRLVCSSGSLGCGLPVAVGHALARPAENVYVLLSDGECAEGSVWEALAFVETHKVNNLHVYVNMNGFGAYDAIDPQYLAARLRAFLPRINIRFTDANMDCAPGLLAHYYVLKEDDMRRLQESER